MQNELMRRDLAIARDLQRQLYPPPPEIGGELEIASRSEPARETSGDFYDFIELGPDTLGVVIADVTGKSLAAALVMAMTRSTLRGEARRSASPSEVLYQANQILCGDTSMKQLITTFYGILNTRTLVLRCANAGHLFPTLKRAGRIEEIELCGLPLGARPGTRYDEQTVQLQPGDQLILISDGIVEAMNADRELFGFERLAETFAHRRRKLTADPADDLADGRDLSGHYRAAGRYYADRDQGWGGRTTPGTRRMIGFSRPPSAILYHEGHEGHEGHEERQIESIPELRDLLIFVRFAG